MRRRPFLALVLGLGALLGFGSGIRELRWHRWAQRAALERHFAEICVDAARNGHLPPGGPVPGPGW
jgi:hypothetical protein